MKKKHIGVIGYGKWAKIMVPILAKYFNINFIINSKINYKIINLQKIDWVFVLTNNSSHYDIVKYLLNKKKNVFCEKPLTPSLTKTLSLFRLARKRNSKLYVNDVEFFKNKKVTISKSNKVMRFKKSQKSSDSLLFRLAYHDFYLLKDYIEIKKINDINFFENKNTLKFSFNEKKNTKFSFLYRTNSLKKVHKINFTNMLNFKKKPLTTMLEKMNRNLLDYKGNMQRSVFASNLISILNKKYR